MSAKIEAMNRDEIARLYAMYGLPVIGGGEQTPEELAAEAAAAEAEAKRLADEEAAELKLGDAGKAALAKERQEKKDAIKAAKAAQEELDKLRSEKTEADAEKAKAEEAEAARKGEFEKLANERAESLKTVAGERDQLKAERDDLIATMKPGVDAQWKDVPEEIRAFFDGADDDVIAKSKFLTKSKPAIDKLTATKKEANDRFRKVPTTPKPNGPGHTADDEKARKNQARTVSTI